jgi:hypothetical protein
MQGRSGPAAEAFAGAFDAQRIADPASSPNKEMIGVFGLERDRLTPKSIALFTSLFCRMIFSEKSATFRDHALGLVLIRVRRGTAAKVSW